MLFRAPLIAVLSIALAALLAVPATADAKRNVPFGFFGSAVPPAMSNSDQVSGAQLNNQMALMARSGVESVRVTRSWNELEPTQGSYDFRELDRVVGAAARRRLHVLVNVTRTPRWASRNPDSGDYYRLPPADYGTYGELMRQLVLRYGPGGSLWAENPSLPGVEVRDWQIWNEPSGPAHWKPRPWAPSYTKLLSAAEQAIHSVDRRADVVAGPLVATADSRGRVYTQGRAIRDLFRAGANRWLDAVSVHPFTNNSTSVRDTARRTLRIVRQVRSHMNRRGARRKPILLTEMTWPASLGKIPRGAQLHFSVTPRGQAARLKAAYRALARARRKLGVSHAYWYTWATSYDRGGSRSVMAFNFSGLTRFRGGSFRPMRVLRTYRNVARQYEGCRKTANARRCRR